MKCPLCQEEIIEVMGDYFCRNRVKFPVGRSLPHYEIREDGKSKWFIPPYYVINYNGKSNIHEFDNNTNDSLKYPSFKFITQCNELPPDEPNKIIKRIKRLIIFS